MAMKCLDIKIDKKEIIKMSMSKIVFYSSLIIGGIASVAYLIRDWLTTYSLQGFSVYMLFLVVFIPVAAIVGHFTYDKAKRLDGIIPTFCDACGQKMKIEQHSDEGIIKAFCVNKKCRDYNTTITHKTR